MSLKALLMPAITQRLFSEERLLARRARAERQRRARGERHRVLCFHQVDDPFSALLAQALPRLVERYDIELLPRLVGPPADAAAPERDKLVAWSRRDAALLARHHGLAFTDPGSQPAPAAVAEANAALLAAIDEGRFADAAAAISLALWQGQPLPTSRATADQVALHIAAADEERERLGHYLGAMLCYGGEWYWGIDRLHHLERRLRSLGAARSTADELLFPPDEDPRESQPAAAPPRPEIHFFVSLRSPYSAIVTPRVFELGRLAGAAVRLRWVLPMMMRGLPVPAAKRRYIAEDAAREARHRGIPFGRLNDPLGKPTERGLALLGLADRTGRGEALLRSFMQGVWAEGIDAGSDRGLRRIAERAGLDWGEAREALLDERWRAVAEANRAELFALGLWGVPSLRVGELAVWGQDRLWAVREALLGG